MEIMAYSLTKLISNTEERTMCYKQLLEEVGRDKEHFPPTDEFVIWFKSHLREEKSRNQSLLKELIEEKTYENEGLNPPYCYKK